MDIYEKILTELKGIKTELAILNKSNSDKLDSAKDNMIQSVEGMMSERLSKVKAQKAYQEGYSMAIDIISKEFQYELNKCRELMYEFANGVITAQIELNKKCKTCLDGANFKNCEKCSIGKAKDTLSKLKGDAKIIAKYENPEIIGTDGKVNKCSGGLSFTFKPVISAAVEEGDENDN